MGDLKFVKDQPIPSSSSSSSSSSFHRQQKVLHVPGLPDSFSIRDLPDWIADYVTFHKNNLDYHPNHEKKHQYKLKPNVPYLKYIGKSGGAGDRINSILSGLYLAMCTNRTYLVSASWKPHLDEFFQPNLIQWNPKHNSTEATIKIKTGWGEIFKNPWSYIPKNTTALLIKAANFWGQPELFTSGNCTKRLMQEAAWRRGQGNLNLDHHNNFVPLDYRTLYYYLFWTMFKFTNSIHDRSQIMLRSSGIMSKEEEESGELDVNGNNEKVPPYYVGVHIRTGDTHFKYAAVRHVGDDIVPTFYECAKKVQSALQQCVSLPSSSPAATTPPKIYIASDNPQTKDDFQQRDPTTIHKMDMDIIHVDRSLHSDFKDANSAVLDVWAELKLLVDATCLVFSRSGYSEMAAWVGSLPRCAVRFNECSNLQVKEALNNIGCT